MSAAIVLRYLRENIDHSIARFPRHGNRTGVAGAPMSVADACLVRMTETLPDPVIVTTDADFKIYRRHSRQVVPCLMP